MRAHSLLRGLREQLDDGGLRGSFLVRDLRTGEEIGIEPDLEFASASLVKVPLAIVTLDRIRRGELDGAEELLVRPGVDAVRGPTGLGLFRHPARVAIDDLVYLSVVISDNIAADLLFARTPPAEVAAALKAFGIHGISVRHTLGDLMETPQEQLAPDDAHLAHTLAIQAGTAGRGHSVPQLDVTRANAGSARAYVDLLQALWLPSAIPAEVAARVRELMGVNIHRQRLTPDFNSDASPWASKTGSVLNLRHEIGVVAHSDGDLFAVAALTESRVPALVQPEAEALMGQVARRLRDHLRARA
ncbi:serine hydrolase [Spiractinospora alimapuensis]|uniref:serine hydrolase n=1 Tax=Spiractinospora alimapuensis TaxID=2820884 RepID=UPI001F4448D7|nr:serine hydrolase [Spiractinospora alimapuensis]QVQ50873.1 serine hydrolase [Spiractinospora alimapuensis]